MLWFPSPLVKLFCQKENSAWTGTEKLKIFLILFSNEWIFILGKWHFADCHFAKLSFCHVDELSLWRIVILPQRSLVKFFFQPFLKHQLTSFPKIHIKQTKRNFSGTSVFYYWRKTLFWWIFLSYEKQFIRIFPPKLLTSSPKLVRKYQTNQPTNNLLEPVFDINSKTIFLPKSKSLWKQNLRLAMNFL